MWWNGSPTLTYQYMWYIPQTGCSHTLHRNYLLPTSNILEQEECANFVGEDGTCDEATLKPHEDDVLPVKCLTESQPESMPNSLSKQHEQFKHGLTSTDPTDEGLHVDNDTPVPLRQTSSTMRNQFPLRYQNLALQQNNIFFGAFNIWVGLCICLHIMSCVYIIFFGKKV